jgi:hypothetical protein
MHHKYLITDAQQNTVNTKAWISSHNWTSAANSKNDENTVVVYDPIVVNQYYQEFAWLFSQNGGIVTSVKSADHINSNFKIYPNPSNENPSIEFLSDADLTAFVSITDIAGKIVSTEQFSLINGYSKNTLNTSMLTVGTYFVTVKAGDSTYQSKFLKY